jgi:hypothetical protein
MQWEFIVALVLGIPVILFPVVFVWYLNIGGIYTTIQEKRRVTRKAVTAGHAVAWNRHNSSRMRINACQ